MTREGRKPYIQQARTDKWLTCFAWKMTETINNMSKWLATNFAPIDRLINPLMAAAVVWKWFDETSFYLTFEYLLSLHQRRISSLFKAAVVNQLRSPSCALLRSVLQSDDLKKKKKSIIQFTFCVHFRRTLTVRILNAFECESTLRVLFISVEKLQSLNQCCYWCSRSQALKPTTPPSSNRELDCKMSDTAHSRSEKSAQRTFLSPQHGNEMHYKRRLVFCST